MTSNILQAFTSFESLRTFVALFVAWRLLTIIWRLTLHPLARFPGPLLARSTDLYAIYHDVLRHGSLVHLLPSLHEKYGPVVRIAPDELHIFDFEHFQESFKVGSRFQKPPVPVSDTFSGSFLHIEDPKDAKVRKAKYSPHFSSAAINRAKPMLYETVNNWKKSLEVMGKSGQTIDMTLALHCLTLDVITQYGFAQNLNTISHPRFEHPFVIAADALNPAFTFAKYFPRTKWVLDQLLGIMPTALMTRFLPGFVDLQHYTSTCAQRVASLDDQDTKDDHTTSIFERVIRDQAQSDRQSTLVLGRDQLASDALLMISAGMSTTAHAAEVGVWNMVRDLQIQDKLRKEITDEIQTASIEEADLIKLPYLTAVVKESLRLSYGVVGRLDRIVPPDGTVVGSQSIPSGAMVSHSISLYNQDASVFDDPARFDPSRWLAEDTSMLDSHMMSFSKGTRSCLGESLAKAELYFIFAMLVQHFVIRNSGTSDWDMEWSNHFVPVVNGHLKVVLSAEASAIDGK